VTVGDAFFSAISPPSVAPAPPLTWPAPNVSFTVKVVAAAFDCDPISDPTLAIAPPVADPVAWLRTI
jgi:hypothetical protein